jgi:dipeptidase
MCDTFVVRTDGGILFAKNSDRDPNEAQIIRWHAAADHPDGSEVDCTHVSIPQVRHTHAIMVAQPWWMWGAEMGANSHGVVIGNQAVFNRAGHAKRGLLGMDLLRLALERADSAHAAVAVIVELLEAHGQGGSHSHDHPGFRYDNSYLVVDRDEAIVLETARRSWATETVTGRARSISNGYTIPAFARAHADPVRARVAESARRRCRTEQAATTAKTPADLFAALRDHGDRGVPTFRRLNGALGAPCAHAGGLATTTQTVGSWVADLRNAPLHWVTATAAPCTSIFKPARVEEPSPLDGDDGATNRFDPGVAWWRHELLHRRVMRDHAASIARFGSARDRLETAWLSDPPSTADAWKLAGAGEAAWTRDLLAAALADTRSRWLRTITGKIDRAARMPREGTAHDPTLDPATTGEVAA